MNTLPLGSTWSPFVCWLNSAVLKGTPEGSLQAGGKARSRAAGMGTLLQDCASLCSEAQRRALHSSIPRRALSGDRSIPTPRPVPGTMVSSECDTGQPLFCKGFQRKQQQNPKQTNWHHSLKASIISGFAKQTCNTAYELIVTDQRKHWISNITHNHVSDI